MIFYHNPRCSKSREALELLRQRGIVPEIIDYLKMPPDAQMLRMLIAKLGISAHAVLRPKEPEYAEAKLSANSSEDDIIAAIAAYPKLLERPIAVHGDKAIIGRPPERVLEII